MEYATVIVMLALIEYLWFTGRVGAMRAKHGIKAPATSGHEEFERAFRVQQNTLEELIVFVPATFTYAWFSSSFWVIIPGAIFLLGRLIYSSAYMKDPGARGPGFGATMLANTWLIVGTLVGVSLKLF